MSSRLPRIDRCRIDHGRPVLDHRMPPGCAARRWRPQVMEPPYHLRLDRKAPAEDGSGSAEVPVPRAGFKKEFDATVFGTTYF